MKRQTTLTRLSIVNAEFFAFHGVREEERNLGGRFQVDVDVWYDTMKAVVSDDLSDTVNYEEVLFLVNEHMNGEPCELIETLSFDMASAIIDRFVAVRQTTVRVRKLNVPIQQVLDHVEAEITVVRED
ncbi:MAG: dihydroneopterin aldolase [Ignavibacteria bacterium]|jgi:dihydroneopterin aldolase|nr:dihydroneopterin aldolase [Ignavibacteria bacterium]MBP6509899.1 dihydroneopterin aldolase [Candidatus Kapabacteria bacterium]MBK6761551.1 dihydroneopterin aldolase [Ignavibacteria bacterium]MBK7033576.1 dihydroneopterin aldolase [Ignavibacteria bacterium]MBK7186206.1 dihydroneopterin aldolase [Ignavibacteria bacterium]